MSAAVDRLWWAFGQQVRDLRLARDWSVAELARRSGLSPSFVYLIEGGQSGSAEGAVRLAIALGKRAELTLADPRQREDRRPDLASDLVHSLMGEFETAHFRRLGVPTGVDVPYQHYQYSGRADVIAWDLAKRALLHIENRTRFPDFQSMAGSFNGKRAYLADSVGKRVGVRRWASQTHAIAALWSAESLHVMRLRADSFRALCPDPPDGFSAWWAGDPPIAGDTSTLIVLDPRAHGRKRAFVGLEEGLLMRPRYRGYGDAASQARTARPSR